MASTSWRSSHMRTSPLLSNRLHTRIALAVLSLLLVATALPARAQEDPDIVDDGPQDHNNAANVVNFQVNDSTFDQWVFGNSMHAANASTARLRLESALDLQIASLNGVCPISNAQKKKLQLAGRGDIKRFFDLVEEKRVRFNLVKRDQQKFGEFYQEVIPLQQMLGAGLFRESSLFSKTLQSTLNDEQSRIHDKLLEERRRFRWKAKVELVADMWVRLLGLSEDYRNQLVDLILKEIPAPKNLGQLDYYFVMYKLSQLPREQVRPIFDESLWKSFEGQMDQARGYSMFLKQQGYDESDLADSRLSRKIVEKNR